MTPFPDGATLNAWKQAYRTLQAPSADACLTDKQFIAMVLQEIQVEARAGLADHIVQCQRCTQAYQWLLHHRAAGM